MPINRYPSDLPQSLWWLHPQQPPLMDPHPAPLKTSDHHHHHRAAAPPDSNRYNNDGGESENPNDNRRQLRISGGAGQFSHLDGAREAMFEKPLTPSDVGKLNRLVIPKQHAEKYFPLGGGGGADSAGGGGGLLLSFEDESGKLWRFRYSYWNSSQSYVLTKGWSRFVKEKRLDAGDVVLFLRHRVDPDRFFIGWRRRGEAAAAGGVAGAGGGGGGVGGNSGEGVWGRRVYYSAHAYPVHSQPGPHGNGPCFPYQPDCLHAGACGESQTSSSSGNFKTLRLFGVNMECHQQQPSPDESKPSTPDGSPMSSQGGQPHYYHYTTNLVPSPSNHMAQDTNFLKGVSQMRYHQG